MKNEGPDLSRIYLNLTRNIIFARAWKFGACKSEECLENEDQACEWL
jgi:hypothetical protein